MNSSRDRRRRALAEEERRLWERVVASVTPLDPDRAPVEATPPSPPLAAPDPRPPRPEAPAEITAPAPTVPSGPSPGPSKRVRAAWVRAMRQSTGEAAITASIVPRPPALAPLDDRTRRRLVRGVMAIDERLDLHGLTQEAAHAALRRFLVGARDRGARVVLVITGKGRPGVTAVEMHDRGVLRRSVPHWLADPGLRSVVVGFEEAHLAHGGSGAIYVRLRRRRDAGEEAR